MQTITFFLNEVEINPPSNWEALAISINFDKDAIAAKTSINDWQLVRENTEFIQKWIDDGKIGAGPGIFEGIPFRIQVEQNGITKNVFDGYLDLTEKKQIGKEVSIATAKEKYQIDWLNDVAAGISFERMFQDGIITKDDFIFQPYICSNIPDYVNSGLALVTVFIIEQEIEKAFTQISQLIAGLANVFEATTVIRAAIYMVYLIALLATLAALIIKVVNMIIQPVKYHAGMKIKTLFEKGCQTFGLTFSSTIFDGVYRDAMIIPQKYSNPQSDGIFGFTSPDPNNQLGYYKGTFADFIRAMKTCFNGKIILKDGNLCFERRDYNTSSAMYVLPDIENREYTLNTEEFNANFLVSFETDTTEKNTIIHYTGNAYQVHLKPKIPSANPKFVLMKNFARKSIPFALVKRKTELTFPEEVLQTMLGIIDGTMEILINAVNEIKGLVEDFIKAVNAIIDAINTLPFVDLDTYDDTIDDVPQWQSLGDLLGNRIGMMKLDHDFFSIAKIYIPFDGNSPFTGAVPVNNKVSEQNITLFSARYIWDNFYFIDSFAPSTARPNANQYEIRKLEKVSPFCLADFILLQKNNKLKNAAGEEGEATQIDWIIKDDVASIEYRINKMYTSNLIEQTYEPTGR